MPLPIDHIIYPLNIPCIASVRVRVQIHILYMYIIVYVGLVDKGKTKFVSNYSRTTLIHVQVCTGLLSLVVVHATRSMFHAAVER